jgi:hypothetical protein
VSNEERQSRFGAEPQMCTHTLLIWHKSSHVGSREFSGEFIASHICEAAVIYSNNLASLFLCRKPHAQF